jgi:hypothetical protein
MKQLRGVGQHIARFLRVFAMYSCIPAQANGIHFSTLIRKNIPHTKEANSPD